jgi:hypothetical protein
MRCSGREHNRALCPGVMSEGGSSQDSWEATMGRSRVRVHSEIRDRGMRGKQREAVREKWRERRRIYRKGDSER